MDFFDINLAKALGGGGGGSSDFRKVTVTAVDADAHTLTLDIKAKEAYDGTETLYFTLSQEQIDDLGWTGQITPETKTIEFMRQYAGTYSFAFSAGGSALVAQGLSADDNIVLMYQ